MPLPFIFGATAHTVFFYFMTIILVHRTQKKYLNFNILTPLLLVMPEINLTLRDSTFLFPHDPHPFEINHSLKNLSRELGNHEEYVSGAKYCVCSHCFGNFESMHQLLMYIIFHVLLLLNCSM